MYLNMQRIGRYEIQKELGRGAMGVVYAAVDPLIGRQVAIKTIRLGALEPESNHVELTQRLHREARAAGVLSHPGIVTIYDVETHEDEAYIVMEFIDGKTVEEMLNSGIPQRSKILLSLLRKTAEALDYAHTKGIIHRDIKPSNIMVCSDGTVKIADFGVAKLTASASVTQSGFVLGTPSYMSPEQAQGRTINGRSDQFSLAVVAYRMLTGKLPFEGSTLTALLAKILWEEPEYESAGLKAPARSVFERALAKDPQLRYPSCIDFARELECAFNKGNSEQFKDIPLMADQRGVSADSREARVSLSKAGIPAISEAEGFAQDRVTKPTGKKSALFAWAGLSVVVLAIFAFWTIQKIQKPIPSVQKASPDALSTLKRDTAEFLPPSEPLVQMKKEVAPPKIQPSVQKLSLDKSVIPGDSVSKIKSSESSIRQLQSATGVLTWSGILEKNSILVIDGQKATIGNITGQLPGKPVSIVVEPKDLVIRQKPSEINRWNQIILYSGNQKLSSITIRWQIIQ
jgi:serine/threonine protein kinase